MAQVLQTRNIGMKPHYSGHPLAPMEIVFEVEEPPKKRIPLGAKLLGVYIIFAALYTLIQGGINTYNNFFS
jgi:hypothetical protein